MKNKPMAETANSTPNVSSRSHLEERVPRLRFPGFEGEWEWKLVSELLRAVNDKSYQIQTSEYHDHGRFEIVDQGKNAIVGYSDIEEKLFKSIPIIVFGDHTTTVKYRDRPFIVGGDGVKLLASCSDKISLKYLFYALLRYGPKAEGYKRHYTILKEKSVPIPLMNEQEALASLLSLIDCRITALRRLVELLKKHKRGLLRKVFEECAEGDRSAFCEIASRRTEKISPSNDSTLDCIELEHIEPDTGLILGSVPLREQSSLKNRCRPNDIIFGKLRPYLRKFVFAESECAASSETWVLTAASGINPRFLFYLIQSEPFMRVANISSGTKMPRSEWSNVANAQFAIPSQSRQQTIADCFSALDMRIQDAQKTFLAMQAYKRGLLQQLFV